MPYQANTSFRAPSSEGTRGRFIEKGTVVGDDDPILDGREHLFNEVDAAGVVERATANPGEKRTVTTKKKKADA